MSPPWAAENTDTLLWSVETFVPFSQLPHPGYQEFVTNFDRNFKEEICALHV